MEYRGGQQDWLYFSEMFPDGGERTVRFPTGIRQNSGLQEPGSDGFIQQPGPVDELSLVPEGGTERHCISKIPVPFFRKVLQKGRQ